MNLHKYPRSDDKYQVAKRVSFLIVKNDAEIQEKEMFLFFFSK